MKDLSRRGFLKVGGAIAGSSILLASCGKEAPKSKEAKTSLSSPGQDIVNLKEIKTGEEISFNYPDKASPCVLMKMGKRVPLGVGPDGDIVAFSSLCSHMGCGLKYDNKAKTLKCQCHFTIFDPELAGQQVCGQATVGLPQIILEHAKDSGMIRAIGVDGLIYGRQSNFDLGGKS